MEVHEEVFLAVVRDATAALEKAEIDYGLMGAMASALFGRPRWTLDVDIFIRPQDVRRTVEELAAAGFESKASQHNPRPGAGRPDLHRQGRHLLRRADARPVRTVEYHGVTLRVVPRRPVYERSAAPAPLAMHRDEAHLIAHLRERLADDPRVNELNIDGSFEDRALVLRGRVSTAERRGAVEDVAAELLPNTEIVNQVTVVRLAEGGRAETVA